MTLMLLACWVGSPVAGYKSVHAVRRRGPAVSAALPPNCLSDLWHGVCLQMCAPATSQRPPTVSLISSTPHSEISIYPITWSLMPHNVLIIIYTVLPQLRIQFQQKLTIFGKLLRRGQIPESQTQLFCYAAVAPWPSPAAVAPWQLLQARMGRSAK